MAASSTTRRGNGAGWGGPAKGASTARIKPGDPDGIQAMSNDAEVKALADARRLKVMAFYERVVDNEAETTPNRLNAGDKLLDRIDGKPMQRQDVTSKGEQIGYVIAAPEEDESPEAWQARQSPD